MTVYVIVTLTVRADKLDAFLALAGRLGSHSRREPGCLRFEVLRQPDAPCCFLLDEAWADAAALEAHKRTEHHRRWRAEVPDLLAVPRTHDEYVPVEIKRTMAFANGCFDTIHAGHVAMLREAKAQADILVVGLNSDASVRALKGPGRPVNGVEVRRAVLESLACVDRVEVFDEPTPLELIRALRPDVLVKSEEYEEKDIVGAELVQSYGGRVHRAKHLPGQSTTEFLRRIRGAA